MFAVFLLVSAIGLVGDVYLIASGRGVGLGLASLSVKVLLFAALALGLGDRAATATTEALCLVAAGIVLTVELAALALVGRRDLPPAA